MTLGRSKNGRSNVVVVLGDFMHKGTSAFSLSFLDFSLIRKFLYDVQPPTWKGRAELLKKLCRRERLGSITVYFLRRFGFLPRREFSSSRANLSKTVRLIISTLHINNAGGGSENALNCR